MEIKKAILQREKPFWKRAIIVMFWGIVSAIAFSYLISRTGLYTSGVSLTINGFVAILSTLGVITLDQRELWYWIIFALFTVGLMIFTFKKIGKEYSYLTLLYLVANIVAGFALSLTPIFANYYLIEPNFASDIRLTFDTTNWSLAEIQNGNTPLVFVDMNGEELTNIANIGSDITLPGAAQYSLYDLLSSTETISDENLKVIEALGIDNPEDITSIQIQGMEQSFNEAGWATLEHLRVDVYKGEEGWTFYMENVVYSNIDNQHYIIYGAEDQNSAVGKKFMASSGYTIFDYAFGQIIIAAILYAIIQSIGVSATYNSGGSSGGIDPIAYYISIKSKEGKNLSYYMLIWSAVNIIFFVVVNDWILFDYVRAPETLEPVHTFVGTVLGPSMIGSYTFLIIFTIYVGTLYPRNQNVQIEVYSHKANEIKGELVFNKWARSFTMSKATNSQDKEIDVITVYCNKYESYDVLKLVSFVDENALVTIKRISELYSSHYEGTIHRMKFDYDHIKTIYAANVAKYEDTLKENNRVDFFDKVALFFSNKKRQEEKKKKALKKQPVVVKSETTQIPSPVDEVKKLPMPEQIEHYLEKTKVTPKSIKQPKLTAVDKEISKFVEMIEGTKTDVPIEKPIEPVIIAEPIKEAPKTAKIESKSTKPKTTSNKPKAAPKPKVTKKED